MIPRLLAAFLVALALPAHAAGLPKNGVYRDLTFNEGGSEDVMGVELSLSLDASPPTVTFAACEGFTCRGGYTWPAHIAGDRIHFTVVEERRDATGRVCESDTLRYELRLERGRLTITSPDDPSLRARLKRAARPKVLGTGYVENPIYICTAP